MLKRGGKAAAAKVNIQISSISSRVDPNDLGGAPDEAECEKREERAACFLVGRVTPVHLW